MRLRLDGSSVRWVSVHVAMPPNVHSSSTADKASPHRKASSVVSSSVDRTSTVDWVLSNAVGPLVVSANREAARDVDPITFGRR